MSKLLSTAELAKKLGVEPGTIYQWRRRYPDFPKSGFDLGEVRDFLAKREEAKRVVAK